MSTTMNNRLAALLSDPLETMFGQCGRDLSRGDVRQAFAQRLGAMTLWEDESGVYLEADVPGLSHDELELTVENGVLTIRGERKCTEREGKRRYDERRFGPFERVVKLAETVDTSSIDATLNDGVLAIRLSKKPEAQPRKVEVKYHGGGES